MPGVQSLIIPRKVLPFCVMLVVLVGAGCLSTGDDLQEAADLQLEDLLPLSSLPADFEELRRGPALFDGGDEELPPSLKIEFRNAQGSMIALVLVEEETEADARQRFQSITRVPEVMTYRIANEPDLAGRVQGSQDCSPDGALTDDGCAYRNDLGHTIGEESKTFVSVAPIQEKDATIDAFRRDTIVAELWISAVAGDDLSDVRKELTEQLDDRIVSLTRGN
jgi:hypothetical protein